MFQRNLFQWDKWDKQRKVCVTGSAWKHLKYLFRIGRSSKDVLFSKEGLYPPRKRFIWLRKMKTLFGSVEMRRSFSSLEDLAKNIVEEICAGEMPEIYFDESPARFQGSQRGRTQLDFVSPFSPAEREELLLHLSNHKMLHRKELKS